MALNVYSSELRFVFSEDVDGIYRMPKLIQDESFFDTQALVLDLSCVFLLRWLKARDYVSFADHQYRLIMSHVNRSV